MPTENHGGLIVRYEHDEWEESALYSKMTPKQVVRRRPAADKQEPKTQQRDPEEPDRS